MVYNERVTWKISLFALAMSVPFAERFAPRSRSCNSLNALSQPSYLVDEY